MKFKKEFLMDELDLPWGKENVIVDKCVDHRRWVSQHELIFKHGDKFYRTFYKMGLTECQEDRPWDYDDEVECVEVEPFEEVITSYREVTK